MSKVNSLKKPVRVGYPDNIMGLLTKLFMWETPFYSLQPEGTKLHPVQFCILVFLAYRFDLAGDQYQYSAQNLADEFGVTVKTLNKYAQELIDWGFITCTNIKNDETEGEKTNKYYNLSYKFKLEIGKFNQINNSGCDVPPADVIRVLSENYACKKFQKFKKGVIAKNLYNCVFNSEMDNSHLDVSEMAASLPAIEDEN